MNFKRFHESKNLYNGQYMFAYIDSTGKIIENAANVLAYAEVEPNTTYTVSADLIATNGNRIAVFDAMPTANLTGSNVISISQRAYQFTITTNSDTKYIAWHTNFSDTNRLSQFLQTSMLNTGSQPLPYEPYSSEVWHDTPHYIHNTSTDTITTLPAALYPTGTTATVGLKGQAVQSGTPTSDNPIMPEGTGERTGQLIDYMQSESGGIDGSGNYVWANNLWRSTAYTPIDETLQYFVSWTANTNLNVVRINYYTSDKTHISREQINTSGTALTIPQNAAYLKWTLYAKTNFIIDLSFVQSLQLMINTGSTALPYEPFGVKITISSAGQTTPIYLGEVETTRRVKKLVLTGEEEWSYVGGQAPFQYLPSNFGMLSQDVAFYICSHYKAIPYNASWSANDKFVSASNQGLRFKDTTFVQGLDEWKSYLAQQYAAGTPVCVWYALAEPETGIINEPLMKIGSYADEVSNISIPVVAGGDTLSVGTTVQPSEVTVNYKGWHPATDVHERDNGAWT